MPLLFSERYLINDGISHRHFLSSCSKHILTLWNVAVSQSMCCSKFPEQQSGSVLYRTLLENESTGLSGWHFASRWIIWTFETKRGRMRRNEAAWTRVFLIARRSGSRKSVAIAIHKIASRLSSSETRSRDLTRCCQTAAIPSGIGLVIRTKKLSRKRS